MIKKKNLPQNIRLVEYCSRLNKDFPYKEYSNFIALGCKCIDEKNNFYYEKFNDCDHQKMLIDPSLLSYLNKIIFNQNIINNHRIKAAKEALTKKNYENICNLQLLEFSNATLENVRLDLGLKWYIIAFFIIFILAILYIIASCFLSYEQCDCFKKLHDKIKEKCCCCCKRRVTSIQVEGNNNL